MPVEKFEDLVAWQKARVLVREIYLASGRAPFCHDRALVSQIRRASISVMSNIAEGFDRYGAGEFHHFLSIAKASCAEVRSQLYVALDVEYLSEPEFKLLMNQAQNTTRVLNALRMSVQRQGKRSS